MGSGQANALEAAELCQQLSQPSTKLEPSEICQSDRTIGCQKTRHADEKASPLTASSGTLKVLPWFLGFLHNLGFGTRHTLATKRTTSERSPYISRGIGVCLSLMHYIALCLQHVPSLPLVASVWHLPIFQSSNSCLPMACYPHPGSPKGQAASYNCAV
jgi:hypothetical protein